MPREPLTLRKQTLQTIDVTSERLFFPIPRENRMDFAVHVFQVLEEVWISAQSFEEGARDVFEILRTHGNVNGQKKGRAEEHWEDPKYWYKRRAECTK